jgi:putative ABC transport system substrate-binding protein
VDLLSDVVPNLARLAAFVDPANPAHLVNWDEIHSVAEQVGLTAERIDVRSITGVEVAFDDAESMRADAVIDAQSPLWLPVRARVAELALQHHLPALSAVRDYAMSGLLMSYGPDQPAIYRRAAAYVDKVLKGAKPADLPVEQSATFELLVNVTTLQALGLSIPPSVLPLVTGWVH